jgi:glycosyltransferase involved in cell wall biosynthesis
VAAAAAEALVRGIPVIVSEKVGVADDVLKMRAGFVVEGDVESLISAFTKCSGLALGQYRELQKNALSAAKLYSFSSHASEQLGVYAALRT